MGVERVHEPVGALNKQIGYVNVSSPHLEDGAECTDCKYMYIHVHVLYAV